MYTKHHSVNLGTEQKAPHPLKYLAKRAGFLIAFLIVVSQLFSQSINVIYFNNGATYMPGGSISFHITPQDVFPFNSRFVMQLMSADGTTVINDNIGEVSEFFTPVVNGMIPAGIPAGNYRLRIQAFEGANIVATSPLSAVFTVSPNTAFARPVIGNQSGQILQIQCFAESNFFGSVNNSIIASTPNNLNFQITNYSNSFTYTVTFIDHSTGATNPLTLNVFGGVASFNLPGGRPTGYYTIEINQSNASGSTSFSYVYLFSTGNTSLGNLSSENVCVGLDVLFSNDRQVIFKNYPGSFYTVNYGDGSKIDTFTHARFILDSVFAHGYNIPTCQSAGSLNIGGKFRAEILLFNKGIRQAPNNRCNEFVQNGNGTSKLVNTSLAPVAGVGGPPGICLNSPVSILNQTLKGVYGEGNVCLTDPLVSWLIRRPGTSEFFPVPASWYDNPNAHLNLPANVLDQVGIWQIKVIAQNPQGCNSITEAIHTLCVEPPIIAQFTINQEDSVVVCESPITNVKITNTTVLQNLCATPQFRWRVYNGQGELLIAGADYKIIPNDSAANPEFIFNRPGNFRIELVIETYCITSTVSRPIIVQRVLRPGSLRLPRDTSYCGDEKFINFGTDVAHRPSYNSNDGNEKYIWTITGGIHSFENGTTAGSRFPQVRFNGYGTYRVGLYFENACGNADTFQLVTLQEPITLDAGPDRAICFAQDTLQLNGTASQASSFLWSRSGTGTFAPASALSTVYTLSNADKASGAIILRLLANPLAGSVCPAVRDSLRVSILPDNRGENRNAEICSGIAINYTPTSSINNSNYTWTSQVTSGTLSGNTASGIGTITDLLVNPSAGTPAVVVYTIIPFANNCDGFPFTYTVRVNPIPTFTATATPDSICSGSATNIVLASPLTGVKYSWSSSVIAGSVTGNTNATNVSGPLVNTLNNTSSGFTTVRYTIQVTGPDPSNCPGPDTTIDIVVAPVITPANAGADQLLCNDSQVQLSANVPVIGTGRWTQTGGLPATIADPAAANTMVSGLVGDQVYRFTWTITNPKVICPSSADEVQITVRPQTTVANAGNDSSICITGNNTFQLAGNAPRSFEQGRWFIVSSSFSPAATLTNATQINARLNNLQPGTVVVRWQISSDATGCANTNDTLVLFISSPTPAANAGPDQLLCDNLSAVLNATPVSGKAKGVWTVIAPSTGTLADLSSPATSVSNLIFGANNFIWTVTDSICPQVSRDTIRVSVRPATTLANAGNDTSVCVTGNTSFRLSGNAPQSFEAGRWFVVSSSFSPAATLTSASSRTAQVNNLQAGTVVLRWRITSDATECAPSNDTMILTIGAATPPANAGSDQLLCDITTANLTAVPVTGNASGNWTVLAPSTAVVAQPSNSTGLVNGLTVGANRIVWTITDVLCPQITRDTVLITVRPPTTQAIVGADTAICVTGNNSFPVKGNTPQSFERGQWSIVSSSFSPTPSFTNGLLPNTTLTGLQPGVVVARYTITSEAADCLPTYDEIRIEVGNATALANAGPDQILCETTSTSLAATPVSANSVGTWTVLSPGTALVAQPALPNSMANSLIVGSNRFIWTVQDQLCSAINRDTVQVFVRPSTTTSVAGRDTVLCIVGNTTFRLAANATRINETSRWTVVASTMSPAPTLSSNNDRQANLLGLRAGSVTLRWTITNDAPDCPPSSSEITIQVSPATPLAAAGPDQLLCNVTSTTLGAIPVANFSIGRWTVVSPVGMNIVSDTNAQTQVNNLVIGTNTLVWTVSNQACPQTYRDTVLVVVRPQTTVANAGRDTAFCSTGNANFRLGGNNPLAHEAGRWTIVSSTMSQQPSFSNTTAPNALLSGLTQGTVTLRWTITSDAADCPPTNATITLTVGQPTPDAFAGPGQLLCNVNSTTLMANPVSGNATGTWRTVAPSAAVVAEPNNPSTLISNLLVGNQRFVWEVTDALCPQTLQDTVLVIVRPATTQAAAGADTAFCTTGNPVYTLKANSMLAHETGRWTIVSNNISPQPSLSNPVSPNATLSGLRPGTITLRWTITSDAADCAPTQSDVTIRIGTGTMDANAGPNQILCDVTSTTLNATPVSGSSIGNWSVVAPGEAIVSDIQNPASAVNSLIAGNHFLVWNVRDTLCPQINRDTMLVAVRPPTTPAFAGNDTAICSTGNTFLTLNGNIPQSFERGRWTLISSNFFPAPSFVNPSDPQSRINGLKPGTMVLRWTISSDAAGCSPTSDDILITIGNPTNDAFAGIDQLLCDVTTANLNADGVSGFSKGVWTAVAPTAALVANSGNPQSAVNNLAVGSNIFAWTVTDSLCSQVNSDTLEIIVRPPTTQANAGRDTIFCITGVNSYQLAANLPSSFEVGSWTVESGSTFTPNFTNNNFASSRITGLRPGTLQLKWTIKSDAVGCGPTFDSVTIQIADTTPAALAGPDQIVCSENGTVLNATPVNGFSTGAWMVLPPSTATLSNALDPKSAVTNLTLANNQFIWIVTNSVCAIEKRDTVNLIVRPPVTQANAGSDAILCGLFSNSYALKGNSPQSFETGKWRIINSTMGANPLINNTNQPNTTVSGLRVGVISLVWQINNDGSCPPTSDTVTITLTPASAPAIAGPDQQICSVTETILGATAVSGINNGRWTIIQPSAAIVSDDADAATTITGLPLGVTQLIWTVTNNVCPANADTVRMERFPAIVNEIGGSTTICVGQSATITNTIISGGNGTYQYSWQQSTDSVNYSIIPGAIANTLVVNPTQTTWYRRLVVSQPCESVSAAVKVNVLGKIENNILAADQAICINTLPGGITGSVPTGGGEDFRYTWQERTGNGAWTNISGATGKDFAPGVLTETTRYRRIVNTTLCDGLQRDTSNTITIQVNPDARAVMNPARTENCASWIITQSVLNPTLDNTRNSGYNWYVNGQLVGSGSTFPGTTIALPGDSVLIKLVAISRFGCRNDSVSVWFRTTADPVPGFVLSDTVGCGPLAVTITNTTNSGANYQFFWNFGQGQTSSLANPGTRIFPANPTFMDTVYRVTLRVTGGCDTVTTFQNIRVKSKAKAIFTPSKTSGCSPLTVDFRNTSIGTNMQFEWLFGDGTTLLSQDAVVSHLYTTNKLDTFYAKLIARNECGDDTATFVLVVQPNTILLDFAVSGIDRAGCSPHTVSFINNSTGGTLFTWDFGDGNTTTTTRNRDTVRHTYTTAGEFTVLLRASNGCSDTSSTEQITVQATPAVGFDANQLQLCIGDTVKLTNTSESATYRWSLGDGTSATTTNVNKVFGSAGTYRIWLTGARQYTSGLVCIDSAYRDVIVTDTLPTQMRVSDSVSSCIPFTVNFTNTVVNAASVTWDFGDGNLATGNNVSHTYTRVGTYKAVMIATLPGGCNYRAEQTIRVSGPTGTLTYDAGIACFNQPVRFEVVSGGAQQYIYVFGDGDSLVTTNTVVNHIYRTTGSFVPYVILSNGACRLISQPGDTVKIDRVRTGFTYTLTQTCGLTSVNFTDTSRSSFGIANRRWDFGNGNVQSGTTANLTASQNGTFRVVLLVTGASGCVDSMIQNILIPVQSIPGINIKGNPILCEGGSNTLEADIVSTDSIASILWDFGNGQQAQGARVTANYVNAGSFTIRLTVRTVFGCTSTITRNVTVNPTPVVGASNDLRICRGQSTILFAAGAQRYIWSPSNGLSCIDCASPVATPTTTTLYAVTGFNSFGCSSSDSVLVTVAQPIDVTATPSDSLCIGQGIQLQANGAASYQWSPAAGLSAANIADPFARPNQSITYRVVGYDGANCFTDTVFVRLGVGPIPTLELGQGGLVVAGTRVTLNPATTGGPIRDYTWTPANLLSCTDCRNPVATIDNDINYRLTISNNYGCTATDTIGYRVVCRADQVFIPNAFSPDGDGINDVLYVMGKGVSKVKNFRIFTRFGALIYEKANFDVNDPTTGWDGRINGVAASPDVYVYTAEVICTGGSAFTYKGNITLFR